MAAAWTTSFFRLGGSPVAGDEAAAREWVARGRAACAEIAEQDDRELIEQDLDALGRG